MLMGTGRPINHDDNMYFHFDFISFFSVICATIKHGSGFNNHIFLATPLEENVIK